MTLLAHQGGWDEGLLVAAPLLVIVGLLWLAKRRADRVEHTGSAVDEHEHEHEPIDG
ncbi:unannotated protein [freshwater metagenome]|uniref:Unannotated protein n=1 Tax=freshwater metagenome TaxID=449393 RepID=A0A6J7ESB4_9ZZZZ|nr:hypothetical protein [Actinomycetota bacterium]